MKDSNNLEEKLKFILSLVARFKEELNINYRIVPNLVNKNQDSITDSEALIHYYFKYGVCYFDISESILKIDEKIIEEAIFHECIHIKDHCMVKSNKNFKYNPNLKFQRTMDSFIMDIGMNIWTEYLAYSKQYQKYGCDTTPIDAEEIERLYLNINNVRKKVDEYSLNELEEYLKYFNRYIRDVTYFIAVFLALVNNNFESIDNIKDIKFKSLILRLDKLLKKMNYGTYGKYMHKRLYLIGYELITKYYMPNGFFVIRESQTGLYSFGYSMETN